MSYILDATRKAERDRALGQVANLPPASDDWRGRIIYIGVVLLMMALLAAGIWFAFDKTPQQSAPSTVDSGLLPIDRTPVPVVDTPKETASAPDIIIPDHPDTDTLVSPAATATPAPSISPSPRVTVLVPDDWQDLPGTALVASRLPEKLVQLKIGIHVYDAKASNRMVLIGGRRYRQGNSLAEGAKIVEITPEGMVLDYRGTRFHKNR